MSQMGAMRKFYLQRHAAKGETWAQKELDREHASAKRTPVWLRATVLYAEVTNWGVVGVRKRVTKTVVFRYTGAPGNYSEMESAVFPELVRLNRSPDGSGINLQAVNVYDTEEAARAGVGGRSVW